MADNEGMPRTDRWSRVIDVIAVVLQGVALSLVLALTLLMSWAILWAA